MAGAAPVPAVRTQPNGYYIPPRWVPRDYLKQMFGPGGRAIAAYTALSRELLRYCNLPRHAEDHLKYEIREGAKVFETEVNGKKWALYNDTVTPTARTARNWCALP